MINPETRCWTVTDDHGYTLLTACDGTRTPREVARYLAARDGEVAVVFKHIATLVKRGLLLPDRATHAAGAATPCMCDGPTSLHLEITNRCNLKCVHCYVAAGKVKPDELTYGEICAVVDDFKNMFKNDVLGPVAITGGEARLRPDCLDIIAYCRQQGFKTVLFSDAVGLKRDFVEELARLGAWIQVSLDGPDAQSNDPIRGKGTFDAITRGIDLLLSNGFGPRMTLFVTLTRRSIDRASELVQYADDRGIRFINFSQLNDQGRAKGQWAEMSPTAEQWVRFGAETADRPTKHVYVKGNLFGGLDRSAGLFPKMRCSIPSSPRIDCTGNVYPCQLFVEPEHRLGNVRNHRLSELLRSEKTRETAAACSSRAARIERCRSCDWQPLCHSGCPGHAYSQFGTLWHEDALCDVRLYWFEAAAREILGLPAPHFDRTAPASDSVSRYQLPVLS